jgi:hypothetical protein
VALSAAAGLEMSSEGVCVQPGFLAAGAAQMLCAVVRSDDSRRRRRESNTTHSAPARRSMSRFGSLWPIFRHEGSPLVSLGTADYDLTRTKSLPACSRAAGGVRGMLSSVR